MQMGFNNDVDYKGLVVHIQTEDHGLRSKKITSQVFHGGAILESKTISYEEDIASYDDDEKRDERIRKLMKALHKKFYQRIHEGLYDDLLPIGEERVSADHLTVKDDGDQAGLVTPNEQLGADGFKVAGEQAAMAEAYAKNSRGAQVDLDSFEPGQLEGVAEMASSAAGMTPSSFVPLGGLGSADERATAAASVSEIVYSEQPAFRGLDVKEDSLGAVILEVVYSQ